MGLGDKSIGRELRVV